MDSAIKRGAGPVGIVGLGAMGTSIGLALRAAGELTVGFDTSMRHLEMSAELGAINFRSKSLEELSWCRAIFVAVPPCEVVEVARSLLRTSAATVVDVASVKAEIADAIREPRFVPSHPLCGTHFSGPAGGRRELFMGATWAVCPTQWTSMENVSMTEALIRSMGAEPLRLQAAEHDEVMAKTSHLPHVAASSLVHVLAGCDRAMARRMVSGGFLDTTRIARANPLLWADITLYNRAEIAGSIGELVETLEAVREAISEGNKEQVLAFFAEAFRVMEHGLPAQRQPTPPPRSNQVRTRFLSPRSRSARALTAELGSVH
jgi:prephenate dehydrogenase